MKTKIIEGWEYITEDLQKGKKFNEIEILEGWELLTVEDCIFLYNNYMKELNLEDCWFFIEQPFDFNKERGFVARFSADSGGAILNCGGDPDDPSSSLGVRFKRKVLDLKKQKQINKLKREHQKKLDKLNKEFEKEIKEIEGGKEK